MARDGGPGLPRRRTALSALAAASLLGGCAWLTPAATTSGLALPKRLRAAEAAATAAPAAWPDPAWWRGFGSPELDALMAAAIAANQNIAVAVAQLRQADAQVRITGASLLPAVNLTQQAVRQQTTVSTGTAGFAFPGAPARKPIRKFASNSLALSGSYEVDFWGKNRAATEAARQTREATLFNVGVVTITTEASVANTYFTLLAAQEQLAIQQANLATAERVLGVIRARLGVGTATGLEVAQQETVAAQLRAQTPPLVQAVEQNRNALAILVGRPPAAVAVEGGGLGRLTMPAVAPGMTAEVLVRRPDVLLAEANLAAANANVVAARAQLLPSVVLTGSGGFQSLAIESLVTPGSAVFSLAAGLTQPIFRGGALVGQARLTEAQAQELLASYRQAILLALQDTEDAAVALRQTTEQEALQLEAVRSAERAYAISESQLRAGTVDLLTLLNTQGALFNARNLLVTARLDRLQAAVGLFRALGGGWNTPT